MSETLRVARRELAAFFGSPVAWLFIGAFLASGLFVFFWGAAFFARNLADVRPLFDWMPVLLIFLCSALAMRLWSEERRSGTLESLLTLPVPVWQLTLGKFLAALALVAIALALTLPLPVTVWLIGPLDWGPVLGAWLATLLLAGVYLAIGIFVSARTDNPMVALIGATLLSAAFYLIGAPALTGLLGHGGGEFLRLLGTGARFESIARGVIDPRDIYYYLSLIGVFLALTLYSLERTRWAETGGNPRHHRRWLLATGLAVANLLAGNLWLHQLGGMRIDLTAGRIHSISDATRNYLGQLREPLLIRGYFSAETHPLLAPLVPRLRDLLNEYRIAGGGRVRVEFVDPHRDPELEREAAEQYGIRPVAFQTASKYQAGVVNSYFDLLVRYGDQFEVLGFQDLIEVMTHGESELEVRLRNPEYDLTRTIRKVLQGYRGTGDPFAGLSAPLRLRAYVSDAARLPEPLPALRAELESVLQELAAKSAGRFSFAIEDPAAGDGHLAREIAETHGFEPLVLDLLNPTPFYFYLALESGDRALPLPLPESLDRAGLERALTAGIKRFAPGVLRTVALHTPPPAAPDPFGLGAADNDPGYRLLRDTLGEGFALRETDLTSGQVPEDADLLLVVGPENLDRRQQFAIDQFLMQGGTVILAASGFQLEFGDRVAARAAPTGLEDWLGHLGLTLKPTLVLDPRNTPFPIPVERDLGGFRVQEIQTLDYPYFPDVRGADLAADSGITASLGQLTLTWVSPLDVDEARQAGRRATRLLSSSPDAWTSDSTDLQPDFETHGRLGFARGQDRGRQLLAVAVEGRFQSFFAGQPSPLLPESDSRPAADDSGAGTTEGTATDGAPVGDDPHPDAAATENANDATDGGEPRTAGSESVNGAAAETQVSDAAPPADDPGSEDEEAPRPTLPILVETSPESARLILIGSSTFLSDTAISLATEATRSRYLKPLEFVQNAAEWSLEDRDLLTLRGRGQFGRLLEPLGREGRLLLETLNYLLALGGLGLVYWLHRRLRDRRRQAELALLGGNATQPV